MIDWNYKPKDAPKDQRLLLLKIQGGEFRTQNEEIWITIGFLDTESADIALWKFAGWCWSHDHFVNATELQHPGADPDACTVIAWANLNKEGMDNVRD